VNNRCLSATVALCLSGVVLALLAVFLTSGARTSHASSSQATADTPDLIINVEAGDEIALADSVISYTLLYTNRLAQELLDVTISSTLSPKQYYSFTYLSNPVIPTTSFTLVDGSFDSGYTLEWQLGSLPAQMEGWIIVTTTIPPEAEPPWDDKKRWPLLGMSAVITTSTPGVSAGNPQGEEGDSASVMVVGPVLRLTKGDDPDPVRPGRLLTYTLILENKAREDVIAATGIVITDLVPANTTFYTASATGFYSATPPSNGLVIWHPPDPLKPGTTVEVSFTVRLTESMPSCPPSNIRNDDLDFSASAYETIQPVSGYRDVSTAVDDVLEKSIDAPALPAGDKTVFPGGIVTYTISIYNPRHDQPLESLRLTDTFESNLFTFLNMLEDGPTPVTTTPQVVWENLSVAAGNVTSFSFRARVPYHIYIPPNKTHQIYENDLSAFVPGLTICDMKDNGPSQADVTRQIGLSKDVDPDHVLSGGIVTYTITLQNYGDTTINSIRLTDTLPNTEGADFHYVDMVHGPDPVADYRENPVVWDNLVVTANSQITLSFRAVAIGLPLETYGNDVSASSPWTTIPAITNKAKVTIDSPLRMDKIVQPSETFVEETVNYAVTICNVATGTYTIDQFRDYLSPGFYPSGGGGSPYEFGISPPVALAPSGCWYHNFDIDVTTDVGCGNLPKTFKNEKGTAQIHIVDPVAAWLGNAVDLAPLRVNPHVRLEKESDHKVVLPGEVVVYTITLTNDCDLTVHNVTVVDTLPGDGSVDFVYSDTVAGPQPNNTTPPQIVWQNQTIGPGEQLVLAFRARVPTGIELGSYKNRVTASTTDLVCIESIDPTAPVAVVDEIIELSKVASPAEVPPRGIVRYEIRLKNKDSVPIAGVTVTEALPSKLGQDFRFVDMVEGDPEPSEIIGQDVIWRDLTVPGDTTLKLRFDAQAAILFGSYENQVSELYPRPSPADPSGTTFLGAPVTVLPGVVMYKTVFPTQTLNGSTVVYTITLYNQWTGSLDDVRITDTLPANFRYQRMLAGPAPSVRDSPTIAWDLGEVGKGDSEELVFQVWAQMPPQSNMITQTYYNKVEGASPSAQIPGIEEAAPVELWPRDLAFVYLPLTLRGYSQ